jgi:Yip1 domain
MTTPPSAIEGTAPQPAHISGFGRIVGVLVNPKPTFEDIAAKPSWALPLVILVVMSIAVVAVFSQRVGWRGLIEKKIAESSRTADLPADQKEQAVERGVKFAAVITYVSILVAIPVSALIVAAVLMGVFNLVVGARVGFVQSLGIVTHAWVPGIIGGIIGLILLFVKAPDTIDIEHLVANNVGAFLSSDTPKWLMTLGTSLDVFSFWTIALMGIGYAAASPKKVSIGKGIAIVAVCWALYVLAKVGWVSALS